MCGAPSGAPLSRAETVSGLLRGRRHLPDELGRRRGAGVPPSSGIGPFGARVFLSSQACEGFNWVVSGGVDAYYYDATSGNLVAVIFSGEASGSGSCAAGPTTFRRPSSNGQTCAPDGGAT